MLPFFSGVPGTLWVRRPAPGRGSGGGAPHREATLLKRQHQTREKLRNNQSESTMTETPESRLSSSYWRSLNELAGTSEFRELLRREFPRGAGELSALDRRTFLRLMGASLALAGLSACAQPREQIVPYAQQ